MNQETIAIVVFLFTYALVVSESIVNSARNSGLFEYVAIKTAKLAHGSPIRVLLLFSVVTAIVSSVLDNVTTVLLLTPIVPFCFLRFCFQYRWDCNPDR